MLTFTYSFVTLLVEQQKARQALQAVRKQFAECSCRQACSSRHCFESALAALIRFDASHHRRTIEQHLIPEIRDAGEEADALLAELDALSEASAALLRRIGERLQVVRDDADPLLAELCGAMIRCCDHLLERIEREEQELFPLAQRTISSDGWFRLASRLISEHQDGRRSAPHHLMRQSTAAAPRALA